MTSPLIAVLVLASVSASTAFHAHVPNTRRIRPSTPKMLSFAPAVGDELVLHMLHPEVPTDDSAVANPAYGAADDASFSKRPCGMCTDCSCGRRDAGVSRGGMARMSMMSDDVSDETEVPELPEWERQMIMSSAYLESIMLSEDKAMEAVEAFLKRHPPSMLGDATPDDILG